LDFDLDEARLLLVDFRRATLLGLDLDTPKRYHAALQASRNQRRKIAGGVRHKTLELLALYVSLWEIDYAYFSKPMRERWQRDREAG